MASTVHRGDRATDTGLTPVHRRQARPRNPSGNAEQTGHYTTPRPPATKRKSTTRIHHSARCIRAKFQSFALAARRTRSSSPTPMSGHPQNYRAIALSVIAAICLGVLAACSRPQDLNAEATSPAVAALTPSGPTAQSLAGTAPMSISESSATTLPAMARLEALIAAQPTGNISVAAVNTSTGVEIAAGETSGMSTASEYKLLVLEALLMRHQQSGTELLASELELATRMIENSDNEAGYALFLDLGGNTGLAAAAKPFAMTNTVPGISDPTFTATSARDYLQLLRNVVGAGPLDAPAQVLLLSLLRDVQADQRWGIGILADPGTTFANKNGWLSVDNTNGPGENDDGLWVVNSVGIVTVGGKQLLISIFTQHQSSLQNGVTLVEDLALGVAAAIDSSS